MQNHLYSKHRVLALRRGVCKYLFWVNTLGNDNSNFVPILHQIRHSEREICPP